MLSGSRLVRGVRKRIESAQINAEYAVHQEIHSLSNQFKAMNDRYIAARIDDVEAVGVRLLRVLMDIPYLSLEDVPQGGIVVCAEITPADTVFLDPRKFGGIATIHGGTAGHTAVMARSLGLPAVLGLRNIMDYTVHGDVIIVDGIAGKVILRPTPQTKEIYIKKHADLLKERKSLEALTQQNATTKDGVKITLRANVEMPRDLELAAKMGAEGIGLFRTEFMFMNRTSLPTEDEQYNILSQAVIASGGRMVTFRTLDIGGDKMAESLGDHMADCDNPALGLRAIRLSLKEPELLKTQFRAMLRAGIHGNIRILLPLVTTADEVVRARALLQTSVEELKVRGEAVPNPLPPLGVMIEIPAAALSADSLARVSDFFALGTNDLIQYTIAIDRGNDQVADLYNPLNPAVLRLIEFTTQAAIRSEISVSVCGEMASDPKYIPLLLGFGIKELSVGAASILKVKERIGQLNMTEVENHTKLVMDQYDGNRIIELVNEF